MPLNLSIIALIAQYKSPRALTRGLWVACEFRRRIFTF